jgi:voltage-gated potassium channel
MSMNNLKQEIHDNQPGVAYQVMIIVLTLYSLSICMFLYIFPLDQNIRRILIIFDTAISLVFLYDFFLAFHMALSKKTYLRWGWLDLLGSLPGFPFLRPARIPRAVQLAKSIRKKRLSGALKEIAENRAGTIVILALLVVLLSLSIFSGLVYYFEGQAPNANIQSPDDALWWTLVTISTVGYGDYYPVTEGGRLIAVVLFTFGVGIFGVISSTLASWFLQPRSRREQRQIEEGDRLMRQEITELRKEIQAIRDMLNDKNRTEPIEEDE